MPAYLVTLQELVEAQQGIPVLTREEAFTQARALAVQRGLDVTRPYTVHRPIMTKDGLLVFEQGMGYGQ